MSLALAAVGLFLLLAPGVIFRRSYLSYPFAKRFSASSATDEVVWAIIPAVFLHLVGIAVWTLAWPSDSVNLSDLGLILEGTQKDETTVAVFARLGDHLWPLAQYNAALYCVAALLGVGARTLVLQANIDKRWQIFRFSNDWYYLFTGRQWGLIPKRDFDWVWIDALVGNQEHENLYSGILDEFFLSKDGGLEMVTIRSARRAPLAGEDGGNEPIRIPGQALVLKYEQIRNFNLSFQSPLSDPAFAELKQYIAAQTKSPASKT